MKTEIYEKLLALKAKLKEQRLLLDAAKDKLTKELQKLKLKEE